MYSNLLLAIPIDKGSMAEGFFTEEAKKFMVSRAYFSRLLRFLKISNVSMLYYNSMMLKPSDNSAIPPS